ncbi:HesA/MoeB/ThiF family protein [Sphingomonas radiodurans]|uniref:HesA/MoeB/ThiF family protein n=1 Tax=Sphingomonas radiodurans TaxID=2890321 RepID=UPI001E44DF60|nr:molybdopterin-synthase adenylyltransferase MoeB [Sphingomonas radiodurans]WBH17016.1 molybdopterin-synthase adenylyltransferase MoeB [Sphingomonas radiodurans]
MTLDEAERARYARQIILKELGGAGQRRLKRATVAVIGAGGIGSPAIAYLAAAGIGRLIIIDDDSVDLSNLQRQILFDTADVGRAKAEAAAAAARALNPHVATDVIMQRIDTANAAALLAGADVVLDGCDNFATRLAVADAALALKIPLVSAAVGQFEGQLAVYRGWEADKPCYRCLVGSAPDRDEASCAEQGVLGPVTGMLGSMAALEAIRAITPFGSDAAGQLILLDLLDLRFRNVRLPKDPACPACSAAG